MLRRKAGLCYSGKKDSARQGEKRKRKAKEKNRLKERKIFLLTKEERKKKRGNHTALNRKGFLHYSFQLSS